jgi:NADH:ubiquinone oxidoreductase subunit 4 (subunit M)
LKKTFFSDAATTAVRTQPGRVPLDPDWSEQSHISAAEKWGAGLLMFATVAAGIYPKFLLDRIQPAVEALRFFKP